MLFDARSLVWFSDARYETWCTRPGCYGGVRS